MKTKTFNELRLTVLGKDREDGLRVTISMLFIAIPGGIGHFLDSLFNINGIMLGKNRDNYLDGPFGFLLGIIPKLVGMLVGQLLQIVFDAIGILAHLVDLLIGLCVRDFDKLFAPNNRFAHIGVMFQAKFNRLPWHMQGPVGFVFGIIPEILRFTIVSISAVVTAGIHKFFNGISDFVKRPVKSSKSKAEDSNKGKGQGKRRRAKFSEDAREQAEQQQRQQQAQERLSSEFQRVIDEQMDLYEILNIVLTQQGPVDINKKLNRTLITDKLHPDKINDFTPKFKSHLDSVKADPNDVNAKQFFRKLGIDVSTPEGRNGIKTDDESIKAYQEQGYDRAQLAAKILNNPELSQQYKQWYNERQYASTRGASSDWRQPPAQGYPSGKQAPTQDGGGRRARRVKFAEDGAQDAGKRP